MLNFGFIGIGQVGGLFADVAKEFNYQSLAINTAKIDLNVLQNLNDNEKIHLLGYEGAGKDRSIGKEALLSHIEVVVDKIKEHMKNCQVIFPVFALGGGSGSGSCGIILETLVRTFEDKVISPIVFLPDVSESPRSKMNALEAFSELGDVEDIGSIFVIDNQKVMDLNYSYTLKEKYRHTRYEFLNLLHHFNKSTDRESDVSNLDRMDLLTTLSERGCAFISDIRFDEEENINAENLGKRVQNSFEYSVFADTNFNNIAKSSIILELPAKSTSELEIDSIFDICGKPLEIFKGIYEEEHSRISVLVTGLPFPSVTLKRMEQEIKEKEEQIIETLSNARTQSFQIKTSWTDSLKRKRKVKS